MIIVVCPSVTGDQQKQFDLETQGVVSLATECQKFEMGSLCDRKLWHYYWHKH